MLIGYLTSVAALPDNVHSKYFCCQVLLLPASRCSGVPPPVERHISTHFNLSSIGLYYSVNGTGTGWTDRRTDGRSITHKRHPKRGPLITPWCMHGTRVGSCPFSQSYESSAHSFHQFLFRFFFCLRVRYYETRHSTPRNQWRQHSTAMGQCGTYRLDSSQNCR